MKHKTFVFAGILMMCMAVVAVAKDELPALPRTVWLEEMTSPEIKNAIEQGYRTVLVPTAGIEQNGPHMPLNKHHHVVRYAAERIAAGMQNTLVAPIIDYVPEGDIATKTEHMAYVGTISLPPRVFAALLDNTARSLLAHGFTHVFFVGDSMQNQAPQQEVADALREEGLHVYHVAEYYANKAQEKALFDMGYSKDAVGGHAGLRDTSELMFVAPDVIRTNKLQNNEPETIAEIGAVGDAKQATGELGEQLLTIKMQAALEAICKEKPPVKGCEI